MNHYWDNNERRYPLQVFIWDKHFESGHPEVDRQHRQLVDLVNQLALAIPEADPRVTIRYLCQQLLDYASQHFSYEESLFAQACLPAHELALHHQDHQAFIHQVTQLYRTEQSRSVAHDTAPPLAASAAAAPQTEGSLESEDTCTEP